MTITYFFSHDEDGLNFFDNVYSLIRNTPRMEDCYVYVADAVVPIGDEIDRDEWEEHREDSMNALDWIEKENEKLKKQPGYADEDSDEDVCVRGSLTDMTRRAERQAE